MKDFLLVAAAMCALLPAAHSGSAPDYTAAIAAGHARLVDIVQRRLTPGVSAAVVVGERVVWSDAAGVANLEHSVPVTRATRFGLGSIAKALTMAAAVRLAEERLVDLDAPIERYLSDFPHAGRQITLRRLAAHQSGLSDEFAMAHAETTTRFASVDEAYQRIKTDRVVYEPGSETRYATGTYTIIARTLEAAANQSYLAILRSRVLGPLGLVTVTPNDRRAIIPHRSGFYVRRDDGEFEHAPYTDWSHKLAGAGLVATAEDVARFGAGLVNGRLLSAPAGEEMLRMVPLSSGTPTEFALGLRVDEHRGRRLVHIAGGGLGISTWLFVYPQEQLAIALLSNVPTGPMGGRTHEIIAGAFLDALDHAAAPRAVY